MCVIGKPVDERHEPDVDEQLSDTRILAIARIEGVGDRLAQRAIGQIGPLREDQHGSARGNLNATLAVRPNARHCAQQGGLSQARGTQQKGGFAAMQVDFAYVQQQRAVRLLQQKALAADGVRGRRRCTDVRPQSDDRLDLLATCERFSICATTARQRDRL